MRNNVLVRPGEDQLTRLYREQFPALMRIGFLLTGSNDVAEDLVQDVFLRAADRLATVEHPPSYLRAALVNAVRSRHRVQRRPAHLPQANESTPPVELVELHDVLLGLPERQRAAVVLRYVSGIDDVEIAAILDCREATVRSLVHRGLAELRRVMS